MFDRVLNTAQEMKFSNKDFFIKWDLISRKQVTWSHLLEKSSWKILFFAVKYVSVCSMMYVMMQASRLIYCIELIHLTEPAFLLPNLNTYLPRSWMVRRSYLENPIQIIRKYTIQPWRNTSNIPRTTWSFLMKLWNSIKFKLTVGILPFNNWSWLVTSSTWSPYFVWKLFLISKLYISHLIEVMISSIVSFCQEPLPMQVSI